MGGCILVLVYFTKSQENDLQSETNPVYTLVYCLIFLIPPPTAGCSRQLLRQRKKEKGELEIF